ncbi:hypothetical protein T07_2723 [Trichinella nelsoni]|uniref:Uncharacterized protein n=1 Tax=Trichinella nelsoni TaxID=6336 RepID=A0A0V0SCR4_9BILA|nr:hypothetical protein T07_2723 [Trichinella nelsoni]
MSLILKFFRALYCSQRFVIYHSRRAKDALILEAKRAKERSKTMGYHRSGLVKEAVGCWDLLCVVVSEIANVPVRGTNVEPHPLVV